MNIVVPTYNKHYNYNINFLNSFKEFCLDKDKVTINFIVTSQEKEIFETLVNMYLELNIKIVTLKELMFNVDGEYYDDSESFFNTKYPLQSLKKLFAYTCVDSDYIVFDSENLCLKEFYFETIFNELKEKPLLYSDKIYHNIQNDVIQTCNNILNSIENNKWFFLKSYWFFELKSVEELINHLKDTQSKNITLFLKDKIFFEYQLYSTFLLQKNMKNSVNVNEIINKEINFENLLDNVQHNYEYIIAVIEPSNVSSYINILTEQNEKIIRLHWTSDEIKNNIINNTNVCIGTFHWD
jgi:archaellum component FlaC